MGNRDIVVIGGSSGAGAPLREIPGRIAADLSAEPASLAKIADPAPLTCPTCGGPLEEWAELVHRMAEDGRQGGRAPVARMSCAHAAEYREYADMIRPAVIHSLDPRARQAES